MGSSKKQTVSYWYRPFFQLALHQGPYDKLLRIRGGDVDAWTGELTASGSITVDQANLWGGEEKEGGIQGTVDVMFGEMDAEPNEFIQVAMGEDPSNHNGVALLQFNSGRYGAGNPYPKPISVLTERIYEGWLDDLCWYPETAAIVLVPPETFIDDLAFPATSAAVGSYAGVTINSGFTAQDTLIVSKSSDLTYDAWSPWSSDGNPLAEGRPWTNRFRVTNDAEEITEHWGSDADPDLRANWYFPTAAEALAAVTDRYVVLTGSTSYTFWLYDTPVNDNRAGLSLRVWKGGQFAMNPTHVIYDSLTYLQGEPIASIDDASFRAAAERLQAEAFGICTKYNHAQESIEQFRQRILDLIGGECSRYNGKWYLDLIRELSPSEIAALPVLTDDDILDWQEDPTNRDDAVNQVAVKWFDPDTKQSRITPHVHALAAINTLGSVNPEVRDYPEIPYEELANRVCLRDLRNKSTPTRRFNETTNRKPYNWRKGQAFRLQSPKRGIADMVCRVADIDRGTLQSGAIRLVAVQDIFAMPATAYVVGQPTLPPPNPVPDPIAQQVLFEAPYVELAGVLPAGDLAALDADAGFILAAGVKPGNGQGYALLTRPAGGEFARIGTFDWCPSAIVVEGAGPTDTAFTLSGGSLLTRVEVGTAALWGTELVRVDALDPVTGSAEFGRGCGDTVAATHAPGQRVYFFDAWGATDQAEYATAETVEVKLLPRTGTQELPASEAPTLEVTMDQRAARPYPPHQLTINGDPAPLEVTLEFDVAWVHRDRVLQADQLVDASVASIGPEPGTTYTLRVYLDDVLVDEVGGIGGAAHAYGGYPGAGTMTVEVSAVREGLESWQAASVSFLYSGELALSGTLPPGAVGEAYSAALVVSGGVAPYLWSLGPGAPPEWTIDVSTGEISGTATAAGTYTFDVIVEDDDGAIATSPQSVLVEEAGFPYWDNVGSQLNFIGADGATATIDDKGVAWTFHGNAQIDTAESANGTSSLYLDGAGDYISTPDASWLDTNLSALTMEAFFRIASSKLHTIASKRGIGTVDFTLYVLADNRVQFAAFRSPGQVVSLTSTTTVATGAFYHVEVVKDGSTWRLFLNGTLEATALQSTTPQEGLYDLTIGREPFNAARDFHGWIGGWRRTNGVALHTTDFTPPSAPYPIG